MKTPAALVLAGRLGGASGDGSADPPIQVKRTSGPGREVLIRGFAGF